MSWPPFSSALIIRCPELANPACSSRLPSNSTDSSCWTRHQQVNINNKSRRGMQRFKSLRCGCPAPCSCWYAVYAAEPTLCLTALTGKNQNLGEKQAKKRKTKEKKQQKQQTEEQTKKHVIHYPKTRDRVSHDTSYTSPWHSQTSSPTY